MLPAMNGTPGSSNTGHNGQGPTATFGQVDALAGFVRQISGLLEESLRRVSLAHRTLAESGLAMTNATAAAADAHLGALAADLERMSEMVHAAMQSKSVPLGSPAISKARPVTLGEAIEHASTVLQPLAGQCHADVTLEIAPTGASHPAGSIYTAVLNGLQNAIESVGRMGGGRVSVTLREAQPPASVFGRDERPWFELLIEDNGAGLATRDRRRAFDLGYTTKANGSGLGLAVARSVVRSMNGTIDLDPAKDEGPRRGAVLKIHFPAPGAAEQHRLGGAA